MRLTWGGGCWRLKSASPGSTDTVIVYLALSSTTRSARPAHRSSKATPRLFHQPIQFCSKAVLHSPPAASSINQAQTCFFVAPSCLASIEVGSSVRLSHLSTDFRGTYSLPTTPPTSNSIHRAHTLIAQFSLLTSY